MLKIIPLQYLVAHLFFVFGWFSLYFSSIFSYSLIIFGFVILPIFEIFLPKVSKNSFFDIDETKNSFIYDVILYLTIPFQVFSIFLFLYVINHFNLSTYELIGKTLCMGTLCGHSINVAHELGHRKNNYEQFLSKILLLSSLYMHFFIEHNRGHHLKVATDMDPASAKKSEWLYFFFIRSIVFQYISSWKIEYKRLKIKRTSFFSLDNQMIQFTLIQLILLVTIFFMLNMFSVLLFFIAAFFGIILLETINYVEHYGLVRKLKDNGRYEAISKFHSWNSNYPLGRLFFFQLTLHSDHHMKSTKKYQKLSHLEAAPHHPTGYPGMMILSFIPPLFFYCMNDLVDFYNHKKTESKKNIF